MAPGDAPSPDASTRCWRCASHQPDAWTYIFRPALNYEHIDLNLDNPILADIRVRRALLLALDRQHAGRPAVRRQAAGGGKLPSTRSIRCTTRRCRSTPTIRRAPAHCWPRPAGQPGPDGICRNAARRAAVARVSHHRRQPAARTGRAGAAEPVEGGLRRGDHQERAAAHAVRRDPEAAAVHRPDRCTPGPAASPRAAAADARRPTRSRRRQQLGRLNYIAFSNPDMDDAIVQAETELDPAKAKAAVGGDAAHLRRPAAGAAAVLPRRGRMWCRNG